MDQVKWEVDLQGIPCLDKDVQDELLAQSNCWSSSARS
jgi:hypothetical protein